MSPVPALLLIGGVLVAATLLGLWARRSQGRRRDARGLRMDPADLPADVREGSATLVQFSTEVCSRCPQVRRRLSALAEDEGLGYVDIDLTHRPDLASRYRVLQTPTVFLLDAAGAVQARFHGAPAPQALDEALAAVRAP